MSNRHPEEAAGDEPAGSREVLTRAAPPADGTVRYGPLDDQVADVRLPPAGTTGALLVVIHGGFWRAEYDRRHTGPLAADLAARGWLVAQLEYRRTGLPGGGWPGTFDDVAAGVAALPALVAGFAAEHGRDVDPAPPVLVGHSAGGQLALWYAATAGQPVRGVLALAPVADLGEAHRLDLDGGAVAEALGGAPPDVADRYAAVDPARLPAPTARTVLVHGRLDRQVPIDLSRRYVAAVGPAVELVETDAGHFAVIDPLSPTWPTVLAGLQCVSG